MEKLLPNIQREESQKSQVRVSFVKQEDMHSSTMAQESKWICLSTLCTQKLTLLHEATSLSKV